MYSERNPDQSQRVCDFLKETPPDNQRLVLPREEAARKRLREFKEAIFDLKKKFPEVIALALKGSYAKGYAKAGVSDFDGFLYVDYDTALQNLPARLAHRKKTVELEDPASLISEALEYQSYPDEKIRKQGLRLFSGNVSLILESEFIKPELSKKFSEKEVEGLDLVTISKDYLVDEVKKLEFAPWGDVVGLFLFSLDRKSIIPFRKAVIDTLLAEGQKGRAKWKIITQQLGFWDHYEMNNQKALGILTHPGRFEKLYPTLGQAKKYFLD